MNWPDTQASDQIACARLHRIWSLAASSVIKPITLTLLVSSCFCILGCDNASKSPGTASNVPTVPLRQTKVIAQGQILPAGGLIRLTATPGDIVDDVLVKVGDPVTSGKPLIKMRSLRIQNARVEALESRLRDAVQQHTSALQQAKLQVSSAEAIVQQASAQQKALDRQAALVALAKEQVAASEMAVERVKSVARDPLTSSFVGAMQVDQQRLALGEAKLKYEQQAENFEQAKEAAQLNMIKAEQQLQAAQLGFQLAEQSLAVQAIESELKALKLQVQSAIVEAPQDAVVVAINARAGEAAAQFPLIELADITRTICEAEVVELDAGRIKVDQKVTISSPALPRHLFGKVAQISRLVGRPQLAVADPLAKADYRSLNVLIEIERADVATASKWLQLQVQVEIAIAADAADEAPASDHVVPKS